MNLKLPWQMGRCLEDCVVLVGNDPIRTKEFQDWIESNPEDVEGVAEMANLMLMDSYELVSGLVIPQGVQTLKLEDETFSLYKPKKRVSSNEVYDITSRLPQTPRIQPSAILSAVESKLIGYGERSRGSIERGVRETIKFIRENRVYINTRIKNHSDYASECLTTSIPMVRISPMQKQKAA